MVEYKEVGIMRSVEDMMNEKHKRIERLAKENRELRSRLLALEARLDSLESEGSARAITENLKSRPRF